MGPHTPTEEYCDGDDGGCTPVDPLPTSVGGNNIPNNAHPGEGGGALTPGTPIVREASEDEGKSPSGGGDDIIESSEKALSGSPSPHPYTPPFSPPPSSGEGSPYNRDSDEAKGEEPRGGASPPPPKRRRKESRGKARENPQVEELRHKV